MTEVEDVKENVAPPETSVVEDETGTLKPSDVESVQSEKMEKEGETTETAENVVKEEVMEEDPQVEDGANGSVPSVHKTEDTPAEENKDDITVEENKDDTTTVDNSEEDDALVVAKNRPCTIVWEWENDGSVWTSFSPVHTSAIDDAFKCGLKKLDIFIHDVKFNVILERMVQRNAKTFWERRIRARGSEDDDGGLTAR